MRLNRVRLAIAITALFTVIVPNCANAAGDGTVRVGHARFTPITANCIRLEYSPTGQFVDPPSYFAANRSARDLHAQVHREGGSTVIDTGAIRLTYTDDGQPFDAQNLKAVIKSGRRVVSWTPSMKNEANLGGAIRTLDGFDGAGPLDDGVLSRNGWYLLDDSRGVLLENGWVASRPSNAGTDWYLFGYGNDYHAALKSLTAISGNVPLPRRYMLGAWYSRYWPYSSTEYRQIVQQYTDHGFPLDNIVMDMDWHLDGWTGWSWNRKLLPDAENLLAWFHQQGLHVTLNVHPSDGVAPHETQYAAFMRDLGQDPASGKTIPFDAANRQYMDALFKDVHGPLERDGVDFWWLDWQQEEYTRSIPELTNLAWLNELYYRDTSKDGKRGASFSRWGGWGDQRHPIHFSGDASTNWPMLAFEVAMTSASGNSGCFFWSHDIGGHNRGRNEESYTRWCQFGAMSAALRCHSTRDATMDRRPWTYPDWAEKSMRISWRLRSVMFPYLYTSAVESSRDTIPLLRPMYLSYPGVEAAYHNSQQYFLGDNLLVAPIAEPGVGPGRVASQTVWFPGGDWYDWFSGVRHTAGNTLVADDINEFPLFARDGVPIPMQPYTSRMATTPLRTLIVRCYPGQEGKRGAASLYQDDGETVAYKSGAFATTALSYVRHGKVSTVEIGPCRGHYAGQPTSRGYTIELPCLARATRAWVDGKSVKVTYDPALGIDRVSVPARSIGRPVVVQVEAALLPQSVLENRAEMRGANAVLGSTWGHSNLRDIIADSRVSTLDADHVAALLSVDGVGLVEHNDGVYQYQGNDRLVLFAPAGNVVGSQAGAPSRGVNNAGARLHVVERSASGVATAYDVSLNGRNAGVLTAGPAIRPGSLEMDGRHQIGSATVKIAGHTFTLQSIPLASADNVALTADVTASSAQPGYSANGAVDGVVSGYPQDQSAEWASNGEKEGAWIKLSWNSPQTIDRIVLYDRPNADDQVLAGKLTFDDGSVVDVGALPNDGSTGAEVKFAPKTVKSVTFTVTQAKSTTQNAGLSEIAVYRR